MQAVKQAGKWTTDRHLHTPYQLKLDRQDQLVLTMSLVLVHMTAYKCR